MNPPTHLSSASARETFHYIVGWAECAADAVEQFDEELLDLCRRSQFRETARTCCAHLFAAIILASPLARDVLMEGLDDAQLVVGPLPGARY